MTAEDGQPGVGSLRAPDWDVESWHRLGDGKASLDVSDFAGRVIYLFCFQSWCPGCHSVGFPALRSAVDRAAGDPRIAFVAVQTVFEGFEKNTLDAALATVDKFKLDVPVGHTVSSVPHAVPKLMASYRTGGTPWTVVIGPDRVIRIEGFHPEADRTAEIIERLLIAATPTPR